MPHDSYFVVLNEFFGVRPDHPLYAKISCLRANGNIRRGYKQNIHITPFLSSSTPPLVYHIYYTTIFSYNSQCFTTSNPYCLCSCIVILPPVTILFCALTISRRNKEASAHWRAFLIVSSSWFNLFKVVSIFFSVFFKRVTILFLRSLTILTNWAILSSNSTTALWLS